MIQNQKFHPEIQLFHLNFLRPFLITNLEVCRDLKPERDNSKMNRPYLLTSTDHPESIWYV